MAKLGIAVDIGSSNIAGYIVNFDKPKDFFYLSIKNSQTKHGLDLITRLTFCRDSKNQKVLHDILINDLNNLIFGLCKKIRVNRKRIEKIVVSANTIMLHFLLNLDISGFKSYPYISQISGTTIIEDVNLFGIKAGKNTKIILLPPISPYIGADITAGILFTRMHKVSAVKFLIDLGTNAEMVLGNKNTLIATSAAAGPAFKSKDILLGSKFISSVAKMLKEKDIDETGKIVGYSDVSQEDIRNFQLAKSAIRSAFEILTEKLGIDYDKISKILIAGLFGKRINAADAVITGLIPFLGKNKVRSIGNSSLEGAKIVLLRPDRLSEAEEIARKVLPVELNFEKKYQELFIKNLNFKTNP